MRRALAALLLLTGAATLAHAAETWTEVRTRNFTIVSNAGEGTARSTANEFEQARAAYGRIWPWMLKTRIKPPLVLALKDEPTLRRWAPGWYERRGGMSWVSGWAEGADRLYLLLRTDSRPEEQAVTPNYNLYRGYLRVVLNTTIERPFSEWLANGLAAVFGNVNVNDKQIQLGRPVPWEFRDFNTRPRLPLQTVLDVRHDSPLLSKEVEREQFDAQCYVLVHYLLFGDRVNRSAKLDNFERMWLGGATQDVALAESVGDLKVLDGALVNYARKPILSFAVFDTEARIAAERPPGRVLVPAEVAGLRAALHVAMGRPQEAQAAIREARDADPRLAGSYDAEGVLADRDHDKTRAKEAYARAVDLGSTSPHSQYRAAQLLWTAQPEDATLALMRRRLERAVELDADHADALSFLAEVLVQQKDATAALPLAERAVALEPGRSYHRVALARVLNQLGRTEEARAAAKQGLQLAGDDAERSNAERFQLFLEESTRYARARSEREGQDQREKLTVSCQDGDAAACAQVLPDLQRSCDEGRASTCAYIAWLYQDGRGLGKDPAKAAAFQERACAAGDKPICVEHAWALMRGQGVPKNEARGTAELDGLCNDGFLPACTRLAVGLLGKPIASAQARARTLLTRACDGGEPDACSAIEQLK